MDFYREEVLPLREAVQSYFDSASFARLLESCQSTYFLERYAGCLKEHCTGGKCVRAYLVDLGYRLSVGLDQRLQIEAPASYEVFEAGILAHDDIIDNSDTRRGIPSMHVALGGGHLGVSRGICIGDFALFLCNLMLASCSLPAELLLRAIRHQNTVFSYTVSGELLDVDLSARMEYTEAEVLEMYRLKTSCYTVAGPLMLGAILGGADQALLQSLRSFGTELGIAFQIRDDILGVFGDEALTGKSATSDAAEGKKSVLTAFFDRHSAPEARKAFYAVYGHPDLSGADMEAIRGALRETGALEHAESLAREYETRAGKQLETSSLSPEKQALLQGLRDYLAQRKK